jgi:hypothetical protein
MSDGDYERGQMEARFHISEERHLENTKRFDKIEATLEDLVSTISVVKGGLRILFAVGSVSAAVGATVAGIFHYLSGHWK